MAKALGGGHWFRSAPRRRPDSVTADKAYHSHDRVISLWLRGVEPVPPRRGGPDTDQLGQGLGRVRWVVERTIDWLHQFRRLRVRHERRADNASSRDLKGGFETVDVHDVLERVSAMPLSTWHYRAEDRAVRHMGPMAQDFFAQFGLGGDDRSIATVDGLGVSLAAIQALHAHARAQAEALDAQRTLADRQQALIERLAARVEALERGARAAGGQ